MEDDPVLSPEEAPGPKFSLFQVATTGIIVLMAATTAISWYFIRKRQVEQEGVSSSPKPVAERPKEEGDRIARLEKKIAEQFGKADHTFVNRFKLVPQEEQRQTKKDTAETIR